MDLLERIESGRFVGREFLLWLWYESERLEGTLRTKEHGAFGLWIEGQLVLSAGKESTRIKGSTPAAHREAKEALRRGKMPESAGLHLSVGSSEHTFTLKAEQLGFAGLKLPAVLGRAEAEPAQALLGPARRVRRRPRETVEAEGARESHEGHEAFYERMHLTREVEARVEALYRAFLAARLGEGWKKVAAGIRRWAAGEPE